MAGPSGLDIFRKQQFDALVEKNMRLSKCKMAERLAMHALPDHTLWSLEFGVWEPIGWAAPEDTRLESELVRPVH